MTKPIGWGLAIAMVCALLAGCGGGGGGVDRSAHDQLQADLEAAQAELERIEAEEAAAAAKAAAAKKAEEEAAAKKAEEEAAAAEAARIKEAQEEAQKELDDRIAKLTEQLAAIAAAQTEEEEEEEETPAATTTTTPAAATTTATTTPATTPAATTTTSTTQTANASQLAERLVEEFQGYRTAGDTPEPIAPDDVVPLLKALSRNALTAEIGGHATARISSPTGIRHATATRSVGNKKGKTVVYTDFELQRELLKHYTPDSTETRLQAMPKAEGTGVVVVPELDVVETRAVILQTSKNWKISHGLSASGVLAIDGDTTDDDPATPSTTLKDDFPSDAEDPKTPKASYSGSLHGVSGTFICDGVPGCQVQITPEYGTSGTAGDIVNGRFTLKSVGVAAVRAAGDTGTSGTLALLFRPTNSKATIPLYQDGPVGTDLEYMVFGYWYGEPSSAGGAYEFGAFAAALSPTPFSDTTITATYDGTAAGMYVEMDFNEAVDTHRHGEFTANARFTVSNASSDTITGTIDNFKATPVGGSSAAKTSDRWLLKLNQETGNRVQFTRLAGPNATTQGQWRHEYVSPRSNEGTVPPAVTGTFNARIENLLHLVGAFGATKR